MEAWASCTQQPRVPTQKRTWVGSRQTSGVGLMIIVFYSALIEEIQLLQPLKICLLTLFFFVSPKATRWRSSADSGNMETAPVSSHWHPWVCQALTNVLRAHSCRSPTSKVWVVAPASLKGHKAQRTSHLACACGQTPSVTKGLAPPFSFRSAGSPLLHWKSSVAHAAFPRDLGCPTQIFLWFS